MTAFRNVLACAAVGLILASCESGGEVSAIKAPEFRSFVPSNLVVNVTRGDGGLVQFVAPAMAALQQGNFRCNARQFHHTNGRTVEDRTLRVALGSDSLKISAVRTQGETVLFEVSHWQRDGSLLQTTETRGAPLEGVDVGLRPLLGR